VVGASSPGLGGCRGRVVVRRPELRLAGPRSLALDVEPAERVLWHAHGRQE
jgi:hypothetical protein